MYKDADDEVESSSVDQDYEEDADNGVQSDDKSINNKFMPQDNIYESNGSPED